MDYRPPLVPNGPKWSIKHLGHFWAHLDPFGQNLIFCSKLLWRKIDFCLKRSKMVQMSPKMSQMIKNMLFLPFGTIWDPFGPHRDIGKPAMLGHFWSQMGHFWCLPAMDLWLNGPKMASNHHPTWVRDIQVEWAPFLSITASLTVKSTSTTGLLHSLISPLKQTSSFEIWHNQS